MSAAPELDFDARTWNQIPPAERVRRCLRFAQEANRHAVTGEPDVREAYADLARQWLALAAEIEKSNTATGRTS